MNTTRLSALLDELEGRLRPLYPGGIAFGRSAKDLQANDHPPRVVWTTPTVAHQAAQKIATATTPRRTHRTLLTRAVTIAAHCWGESADATEQLVHDLLAATHKTAWGSVGFAGEEWPDDSHANFGTLGVVRLVVEIPVLRAALQRVTPTTFDPIPEFEKGTP